jgi:hypothetical protein
LGLEIEREHFEDEEYERFGRRLAESLEALRTLLARPGFGAGAHALGAELEVSLVDAAGRPLPLNTHVLAETVDPRLTVELERFNLECNLRHTSLAGRPFEALALECHTALAEMRRAAAAYGGRVAAIGILPTLEPEDLGADSMTESMRYRALSAALRRLRLEPFRVRIRGEEELEVTCDDVTFEGANTSFQVHLRVAPGDFPHLYNAIQLATVPTLAAAGNAPTFLGRRLWEETRVALFKQAVDDRGRGRHGREARVSFGRGWLEGGALELFAESVELHEPLLPVLDVEDPLGVVAAGGTPSLRELRLHQGTVWSWNRAIYDPADGGHLRIEMRALPSGPTVTDMLANVAFLVGLALDLAAEGDWCARFPFSRAHHGFYRAAQAGLEATLPWPGRQGSTPGRELVLDLLPRAHRGLAAAGVSDEDSGGLLAVFEARVLSGRTGAAWQRATLDLLEPRHGRRQALAEMFQRYQALSLTGEPVHTWPLPGDR